MFNFQGPSERVGHNNAEGPPVPIPNTEVKLCGADSTVLETVREGRTWPTPRPEKVASPWGCSSDGRAPALQAGGHGFESHHLHQGTRRVPSRRRDSNKSGVNDSPADCQSRRDAGASRAAKESHHLHQGARRVPSRRRDSNKSGVKDSPVDCQSRRRPRCVEHREGIPSSPKGTEVPKRREAACGRARRLSEERAAELRGASGGTEKDLGS